MEAPMKVTNYSVAVVSKPPDDKDFPIAEIDLQGNGGNKTIAKLFFYLTLPNTNNGFFPSVGYYQVYYHHEQLSAVLNILRNETPVFFWFEDGFASIFARREPAPDKMVESDFSVYVKEYLP